MKCIECVHCDLWLWPKHALLGYGNCKAQSPGTFTSIRLEVECDKFQKVDEAVIFKRRDWAIQNELI